MSGILDIERHYDPNLAIIVANDVETLIQLYETNRDIYSMLNSQYALNILKERYTLPFYPKDFAEFLELYNKKYLTPRCLKYRYPNQCLVAATQEGNWEIFHMAENYGANDYDQILVEAIKNRRRDFVVYALEHGANGASKAVYEAIVTDYPAAIGEIFYRTPPEDQIELYQSVVDAAAFIGNKEMLTENLRAMMFLPDIHELDIDPNEPDYIDYYGIADEAGKGGNLDIILWLRNIRGVDRNKIISFGMEGAAQFGRIELIEELSRYDNIDYRGLLLSAAYGGQLGLIQSFERQGYILDRNSMLFEAVLGGSTAVIDYSVSKGANDFDEAMKNAAFVGNIEIMDYLVKYGVSQQGYNLALLYIADSNTNTDIVQWLIDNGANNIQEAINAARMSGNDEMAEYLQGKLKR